MTDLADWQLCFNSALYKWNEGDYDGALIDCESALRINPEHNKSIRLRGAVLYSLGELDEARSAYLKTVELDDVCLEDYFDLGRLENRLGLHESARTHLLCAIAINFKMREDNPESFDWDIYDRSSYYLANSFFNLESYKSGIRVFSKWREMHENGESGHPSFDAEFLRTAACLYDGLGEKETALNSISRALLLDPSSPEIWYDSGVIKRDSGNTRGAVDDFRRAFELNPSFGSAVHNIGSIYFDLGDMEKACHYWVIGANLGHANSQMAREKYCQS